MFELFKPKQDVQSLFEEFDKHFEKQFKELSSFIPKIEDTKDTVTFTAKGPNVVYTITTSKELMPNVLKDLGFKLPTGITASTEPAKPTKKKAAPKV